MVLATLAGGPSVPCCRGVSPVTGTILVERSRCHSGLLWWWHWLRVAAVLWCCCHRSLRLRSLLMLSRAERLGWSPTVWTVGLTNISSDIIRGTSGVMSTFSHNTQLLWQRQLNLDSVINYCILTVYFMIWIFILWDLQSIILMWIFLSLPRYFKLDCR